MIFFIQNKTLYPVILRISNIKYLFMDKCYFLFINTLYYKKGLSKILDNLSDSGRIQTCNRLIRSQEFYSVELRSHSVFF